MQYPFDQIFLMGEGLYASGTATLTSAGPDYPGEFYVSKIAFDKGPTLERGKMLRNSFNEMLFNRIATEIENSDDAEKAFGEDEQRSDFEDYGYVPSQNPISGEIVRGANV